MIHEGVVKAAKKTNLGRLGVLEKDVDRVFGRFVKELYILSQMHSDRYDGGELVGILFAQRSQIEKALKKDADESSF